MVDSLDVRGNNLSSLPPSLLTTMGRVSQLFISGNHIGTYPRGFFTPLVSMEQEIERSGEGSGSSAVAVVVDMDPITGGGAGSMCKDGSTKTPPITNKKGAVVIPQHCEVDASGTDGNTGGGEGNREDGDDEVKLKRYCMSCIERNLTPTLPSSSYRS